LRGFTFARFSAISTPAPHLVTQQTPGGANQSFGARLQPDLTGVRPALLPVKLFISVCELKNSSTTELPQQNPFHQRNKRGCDETHLLQSRSWHVIDRLPLDAATLRPDSAAAAADAGPGLL
jgi:hypothetical protein